jgi:hypothetical protein
MIGQMGTRPACQIIYPLKISAARVEAQMAAHQIQPLQGCDLRVVLPRVARSSQPWAESFNPFGIALT